MQEAQNSKLSKSGDGTLYGAKITGGGSGGTICAIGRNCVLSTQQIFQVTYKFYTHVSEMYTFCVVVWKNCDRGLRLWCY